MKECVRLAGLLCCGMSFILLVAMGLDKRRARADRRRVPERTLFLLALLFGAPGGLLGMYAFRHKTKHWYFVLGFWILAAVQLGALGYFAYRTM